MTLAFISSRYFLATTHISDFAGFIRQQGSFELKFSLCSFRVMKARRFASLSIEMHARHRNKFVIGNVK